MERVYGKIGRVRLVAPPYQLLPYEPIEVPFSFYTCPLWLKHRPANEIIGRIVEAAVLYILHLQVDLIRERILMFDHNVIYRTVTKKTEIDGICRLKSDTVVLYEAKLATVEKYRNLLPGQDQLQTKAYILRAGKLYRHAKQRLIYIMPEDNVIPSMPLPSVSIDDMETAQGIIWLSPSDVKSAAEELHFYLPENWLQPRGRCGRFVFPSDWN